MLKAATEFCWMGTRYKPGDEVHVPMAQAATLTGARLVTGEWQPMPEPADGDSGKTPKGEKDEKGKKNK